MSMTTTPTPTKQKQTQRIEQLERQAAKERERAKTFFAEIYNSPNVEQPADATESHIRQRTKNGLRLVLNRAFENKVFHQNEQHLYSKRAEDLRFTKLQYRHFPTSRASVTEPGLLERIQTFDTLQWYRMQYSQRSALAAAERQQLSTGFYHDPKDIAALSVKGQSGPRRSKSICCNSKALFDVQSASQTPTENNFFLTGV